MAIDPSAMPAGGGGGGPTTLLAAAMSPCRNSSSSAAGAQAFTHDPATQRLQSLAYPAQCLGSTGATLYPGALDIGLVPCASAPAWAWDGAPSGQVRMGGGGGRCLDVDGGNASAGARVLAFACKAPGSPGGGNQAWALAPLGGASGGAVALRSLLAAPPQCLDVEALPVPPPPLPFVLLAMRINTYVRNGPPPSGYALRVSASPNASAPGAWALQFAGRVLASGATAAPVLPGVFYAASVGAVGREVSASWEGVELARVQDAEGLSGYGMAALGSGWHGAWFDSFSVGA
jgi:hypothetical protein